MITLSHALQYLGNNSDQIIAQFPSLARVRVDGDFPLFEFDSTEGRLMRRANGLIPSHAEGNLKTLSCIGSMELNAIAGSNISNFLRYYFHLLSDLVLRQQQLDVLMSGLELDVSTKVNDHPNTDRHVLPFIPLTGNLTSLLGEQGDLAPRIAVIPTFSGPWSEQFLRDNLLLLNADALRKLAQRVLVDGHSDTPLSKLYLFLTFTSVAGDRPRLSIPKLKDLNQQVATVFPTRSFEDFEYNLFNALVPPAFDSLFDFTVRVPAIDPVKIQGDLIFLGSEKVYFRDLVGYDVRATQRSGEAGQSFTYRWPTLTAQEIPARTAHFDFSELGIFAVDANAPGTISVDASSFDGSTLFDESFAPNDKRLTHLRIEVPVLKATTLGGSTESPTKLHGKVLDGTGKCPLEGLVVILEARRKDEGPNVWHVIGSATTDVTGGFTMPYPEGVFVEARALVSATPGKPIPVDVLGDDAHVQAKTTISTAVMYLLVEGWDCKPATDSDCDCHDGSVKSPRLPTQQDLILSDKFSQDLGSGCVTLTTPNRTLHERSYQAIVRTSDPDVANYVLQKTSVMDLDGFQRSTFTLGDGKKVKRNPVSFENPVRWQDAPDTTDKDNHLSFYQSVSVAHGHLLHYKAVLKADGYSLGDLLFSLPLAPGQKKQIISYDWKRSLLGAETQQLSQRESLNAGITSDRTIVDQLTAGISESLQGRSDASTGGVSAGLGVGAIIGPVGAVLGVSGGYSSSSSSASQSGSRDTAQAFSELLRQSVMQSAASYRELNGTLIDAVNEGQQFAASTEVVANHNHCHSLTMLYFEVLRHFAVFQELSEVEECLFVPLVMTNFTRENVHKWRDVLAGRLMYRPSSTYLLSTFGSQPLRKAFDANERVLTNWANVDFPAGRYCDEAITDIHGDMNIRVNMPRPKSRYDRIFSFPIITKIVTHEEFDAKTAAKSTFLGVLTGGLSFLAGADDTTKTVSEEVLVRGRIFDLFMSIDDNFQTASPADCIRVQRFKVQSFVFGTTTITVSGPDFFENGSVDKKQWEAYAAILGYPGPNGVYDMLDYYFAGRLISEWDSIFYSDIVPVVFDKFIKSIAIDHMAIDLTAPRYQGGERVMLVNIRGTTNLARINFPDHITMRSNSASIKALSGFVTFNIERLRLGYSTPHFEGYLFRGRVSDDLLSNDTSLYIPISNEEKRNPKKEDKYLANELIQHLNANLEYYNKVLWYNLDPDRRYLLLDGFNIQVYDDLNQPSVTRSLASVVKNKLIGIAGNALIFPVAAGVKVDRSYIIVTGQDQTETRISLFDHYRPLTPPEPYRISVPTRGVYAEAVQGACDACENIKDNSSQDWDKFRTDEPTPIATVPVPAPAPRDWKATFKDFAPPIVNIQNAPGDPAPAAGLASVATLLGNPNLFRDMAGLAGTQSNAMQTYLSNQENAKAFAQMAKEMATQAHNTENADKIKGAIGEARQSGAISNQDAGALTKDHIQQMIDGGEGKRTAADAAKPSLTQASVDAAAQGKAIKATNTDASRGTSETLEINDPTLEDVTKKTLILLPGVTASLRAFGSDSNDKTGKIKLTSTINNPPDGGFTVKWELVGAAGAVKIDSPTAQSTDISGIEPGLHSIMFSVFDSANKRVASTIVKLCVPQFIIVKETAAEFDAALTALGVQALKNNIIATAKTVAESILKTCNCRLIWQLGGFSETVPSHIPAANVTTVTFRDHDNAHPGRLGQTPTPAGATVFNEAIELYPRAYLDPASATSENDVETNAIMLQLKNANVSDPLLEAFAVKVFGRLFGETLSHEIIHSLLGFAIPTGHNSPKIAGDIMNDGFERTFTNRTSLTDTAHTSPVDPANFTDAGIAAINRLTATNQTRMDAAFPVNP